MDSDNYFEVLVNGAYGGYRLPDIVLKEYFNYKIKNKKINCDFCKEEETICGDCFRKHEFDPLSRTDPVIIELCKKYRTECKDVYVEGKFDMLYKNSLKIYDNDGT